MKGRQHRQCSRIVWRCVDNIHNIQMNAIHRLSLTSIEKNISFSLSHIILNDTRRRTPMVKVNVYIFSYKKTTFTNGRVRKEEEEEEELVFREKKTLLCWMSSWQETFACCFALWNNFQFNPCFRLYNNTSP